MSPSSLFYWQAERSKTAAKIAQREIAATWSRHPDEVEIVSIRRVGPVEFGV